MPPLFNRKIKIKGDYRLHDRQWLGGYGEVGSLWTESVLVGDISHGVLHAVRTQVGVAALANKHIRVANVLQSSLVGSCNSVGGHVAQRVLAMLVVHLGVLQHGDVTAVGTGQHSHGAKSQDDELRGIFKYLFNLIKFNSIKGGTSLPASLWIKEGFGNF